jgi:tRNA A-37 threonylcarbamoyl transferase component Bud32
MTDASASRTAAEIFKKWKEFLDGGTVVAADAVVVADPQLTAPVHRLIDAYLAGRATDVLGAGPEPDEFADPKILPNIPGYTVLERLGHGGMGVVYKVRDPLDRDFALKLVRNKHLSTSNRERFLAEARAMARLNHPHVAWIHHFGEFDGRPYFLMGLYRANLSDRMVDYIGEPRAAVELMAAVADGVGHLHSRGFIHRDLKPSNILLDRSDQPVVSDFGLIKGRADTISSTPDSAHGSAETMNTGARRSETMAGLVLGTRRYMAPEQAAGLNHLVGPTWDVWSLGVILHELLTGAPPRSSAAPERLLSPAEPSNAPLCELRSNLDPRLGRIIDKCLDRDPAKRYQNANAIAADLRAWLNHGWRRIARIVGVGVLLAAAAGTLTGAMGWHRHSARGDSPPANASDEVLVVIQQQLRDGKTVTLFEPSGSPRWFAIAAGEGIAKYSVAEVDQTLRLEGDGLVLMEFPPTRLEQYRFEVEVRQDTNAPTAIFGAYAGRHQLPSSDGLTMDCFATVWFNNWVNKQWTPEQPGAWQLNLRSNKMVPNLGCVLSGTQLGDGSFSLQVRDGDGWHSVAVEIRPGQMSWWFDGRYIKSSTLPISAENEQRFASGTMLKPGIRTAFSSAGGYGLLVNQGRASFRDARIGPILD